MNITGYTAGSVSPRCLRQPVTVHESEEREKTTTRKRESGAKETSPKLCNKIEEVGSFLRVDVVNYTLSTMLRNIYIFFELLKM